MNLNTLRTLTHNATVLLGDAQAIKTGRIVPRIQNRIIGKVVGRALRSLWR